MLGIQLWIWLAVVASVGVIVWSLFKLRHRTWMYRILLMLGALALVWGLAPLLGGAGISPYLVVGAIVAFGFLVLTDAMSDNSDW